LSRLNGHATLSATTYRPKITFELSAAQCRRFRLFTPTRLVGPFEK
jgi:hypothetical protein